MFGVLTKQPERQRPIKLTSRFNRLYSEAPFPLWPCGLAFLRLHISLSYLKNARVTINKTAGVLPSRMKKNVGGIVLHVAGCLTFIAIPVFFRPGSMDTFEVFQDPRARSDFFLYLLLLGFFYANYLIFIPRYYFENRYLQFSIAMILCFLVILVIPELDFPNTASYGPPPPQHPRPKVGPPFLAFRTGNVLLLFLAMFGLSMALKITERWKQTEKEKLGAELSYLKAQINPHFLLNTLNSIYSLAIVKSDNTASAIVRLSGMMRYVLHEAHAEYVSLEKEITHIRSYIELQHIRFGDSVQLSFIVRGETSGKKIAPLILIPFVENAFKHGVNAEQDSVISVRIDITDEELQLSVINNKVTVRQRDEDKSGIGIDNTKGRLKLLYGSKHSLSILDGQNEFKVSLKLELV